MLPSRGSDAALGDVPRPRADVDHEKLYGVGVGSCADPCTLAAASRFKRANSIPRYTCDFRLISECLVLPNEPKLSVDGQITLH